MGNVPAERDVAALASCEAVAVMPGWRESKGATLEVNLAQQLKLSVYVLDGQQLLPLRSESPTLEAERLVRGPRQHWYGHPRDNFLRIAALWSVIIRRRVTPREVGLLLIALKLARELASAQRDNLVDIAGYATATWMATEEIDEVTASRYDTPEEKEARSGNPA